MSTLKFEFEFLVRYRIRFRERVKPETLKVFSEIRKSWFLLVDKTITTNVLFFFWDQIKTCCFVSFGPNIVLHVDKERSNKKITVFCLFFVFPNDESGDPLVLRSSDPSFLLHCRIDHLDSSTQLSQSRDSALFDPAPVDHSGE
jgi:hypothetical protein